MRSANFSTISDLASVFLPGLKKWDGQVTVLKRFELRPLTIFYQSIVSESD